MDSPGFARCITAFSQMRPEPSHRAELISQLRKGEAVRVLEQQDSWTLAETEHGYRGFVRTAQLKPFSARDFSLLFEGITGISEAEQAGFPFSAGSFRWKDETGPEIPGFLQKQSFRYFSDFGAELAALAMHFTGVPYVWGGKTQWGLDCSGLVQLLVNLTGYSFPRDAWQQAGCGIEIPYDNSFADLQKGDLLFFREEGKAIHHVAIALGGAAFIHASEWVRAQSLDPAGKDFAEDRKKTLCMVRRLIPAGLSTMADSLRNLQFHQNR